MYKKKIEFKFRRRDTTISHIDQVYIYLGFHNFGAFQLGLYSIVTIRSYMSFLFRRKNKLLLKRIDG